MSIFTHGLRAFVSALLLTASGAASAQTWQWVSPADAASTGESSVQRTVVDGLGNVIAAGYFSGTLRLGSTMLVSAGGNDLFVARLSPAGQWTQAVAAGGPGDESADLVALDPLGGVVVAGSFASSQLVLGSTTLAFVPNLASGGGSTSNNNTFVARLAANGTWQQATAATAQVFSDLEVRPNGEAVLSGYCSGYMPTAYFGPLSFAATNNPAFVARLNPAGQWTQVVPLDNQSGQGSRGNYIGGMALDAAGNVTVVGEFRSPVLTLGPFVLTNANPNSGSIQSTYFGSNAFLARLSAAGTWTQAGAITSANPGGLIDVVFGPGGEAVVLGSFFGPQYTLGTFVLPGSGYGTLFIARQSTAGTWTQATSFGDGRSPYAMRLALDGANNAVVAGSFAGATMTFGPQQLPNAGGTSGTDDLFAARLSPTGQWLQTAVAGGPGTDLVSDMCLDAAGNLVVNGWLTGPLTTFGPRAVASPAGSGAFVAKLAFTTLAARPAALAPTLACFPNPARSTATLRLPAPAETAATAVLLDALGREVRRYTVPARATAVPIELAGLAPGVYLVRCGAAVSRLVVE